MVWLILGIVVWGVIHSVMASVAFKGFLQRVLGAGVLKLYRLLYNLFSAVSLVPLLYLMLTLPDQTLYQIPAPWSYIMRAGQGLAAMLLIVSLIQTDVLSFAGLSQIFGQDQRSELVTGGLYRVVRHPLYTFGLLVIWLSPAVSLNSFSAYLAFTLYLLIGIVFEERKLLREFGQAYADYKAATPMLIPGFSKSPRGQGTSAGTNKI